MKNRFQALIQRMSSIEYTPRHTRLAGDLASYKPQLEKRIIDSGGQNSQWAIQARNLMEKAEHFLSDNRIDEGWKAFTSAKRLEVHGMSAYERTALSEELQVESSKLNDWRKEAVLKLLFKAEDAPKDPPPIEVIIRAMELKDEHYNNQYYKNTLSISMFRLLFFLLLMFILGIIAYFAVMQNIVGETTNDNIGITGYIIGVLLFGFLGSITSAILFTRYSTQFSRLTEFGSTTFITLSKIFVGAAFSVFIFLIMKSSVADNIQLFSFTIDNPLDYFALAFVSGFSERLAQRAIETIVGKEK